MTIKARLIGVLITIIILMCGAIISQNIAKHKNEEQNQKSTSRYLSYLLADEFRKTSMDLTRLGRSYVATGAQQHWDEYWNIVKWRNGDIDRPSYVDAALYRGERKKQSDIMRELKFSTIEFALLKQASDSSNALIDTETQAMESIRQGRFVEGPFKPFPDESVKQFALRIIFNDDYHSEVNKIMTPVSAFFKALDNRTASDLKQSQDTAAKWLGISLTTQVVVLLLIMLLMFILIKMLFKPLKQAINAMLNIGEGEGDLSKRLHESGRDELSSLGRGFNLFASHVQDVIVELRISIDEISNSSLALNSTANLTDEAVIQQKNSIEQLLTAIEQMLPAVQEVAQNAVHGVKQANLSDEAATDGLMVVEQAISNINLLDDDIDNAASVINQLAQDTNNIGAVLDVIRGISDQTNLLALNAAIEAARAGEAGRGFAVVADEVRTLAQRTQDSTLEIQQMIEKLQIGASNAVEVMDQSKNRTSACVDNTRHAGESLNKITASVAAITDINNQIASATEEQNATIDEIRRNVDNINQHVEQTAEGSQETARNSEFTTALTGKIKSLVDQFKTA